MGCEVDKKHDHLERNSLSSLEFVVFFGMSVLAIEISVNGSRFF